MQILQIHNFYKTPGGECSVVHAERSLLETAGHVVTQYTVDSADIAGYSSGRKALSFLQIPYNLVAARRLARFLRTNRPDVAHVHNVFPLLSPSIYKVLKDNGIPVVQTVHNYRFLCPNGLFFVRGRVCEECRRDGLMSAVKNRCMHDSLLTSAMYAAAIAFAWRTGNIPDNISRFVALNRFGKDMLVSGGIPEDKIRICGNFVESFAQSPEEKEPYILYMGRLSSEKGLLTLLKAMQSVPAGVVLKIAGSGPLETELRAFVTSHPTLNIQFLGFVSGVDKEHLIARALCMVVPSEWYENFPISVVESLALGTPVIAGRMGGLPEMIEHGKTGLLFDSGNEDELAKQIVRMVEDQMGARHMALAALEAARLRFAPDVHIRELVDIYNDAMRA